MSNSINAGIGVIKFCSGHYMGGRSSRANTWSSFANISRQYISRVHLADKGRSLMYNKLDEKIRFLIYLDDKGTGSVELNIDHILNADVCLK